MIPDYQRPYKLTAKNAIQLLDDIVEAKNENKETYRVGTLILHQEGEEYNIVDGRFSRQRLYRICAQMILNRVPNKNIASVLLGLF